MVKLIIGFIMRLDEIMEGDMISNEYEVKYVEKNNSNDGYLSFTI